MSPGLRTSTESVSNARRLGIEPTVGTCLETLKGFEGYGREAEITCHHCERGYIASMTRSGRVGSVGVGVKGFEGRSRGVTLPYAQVW